METSTADDQDSTKDSGGGGGGGGNTGTVRRPMNAFLIFCKRHRSLVRDKNQHLDNRSVTRILGELWATLPAEEKVTYTDLAKEYKDAFMKANPDYKWYNPEKSTNSSTTAPAQNKSPTQPLSRHRVLTQGRKTGMTGDAVTPGKLADPTNMGGLNLLLMAGNSLDMGEKTATAPTRSHTAAQPGTKATTLLQLAEMCTTALEEPQVRPEQQAVTDHHPRAVTVVRDSYVAVTPPWTPKYDTLTSAGAAGKSETAFDGWTAVKSDSKTSPEAKFTASRPSNQISSSKSSTPMFRTKAALKSPPMFVSSQQQQQQQEMYTQIRPTNKKLYSIVPVASRPPVESETETDSIKGHITMDNFIESMFCHEGKVENNAAAQKSPVAAVTSSSSSSVAASMTFGQIQEQLIRKAMESAYTSPAKTDSAAAAHSAKHPAVVEAKPKLKAEAAILPHLLPVGPPTNPVTVCPPPLVAPSVLPPPPAETELKKEEVSLAPFLFPFIPGLPFRTVAPKSETETEHLKVKEEERGMKEEEEEEEEDLTCHEQMDEKSPVTREEIEKKLLSSAEKIQAALSSDLPVATPRLPPSERGAASVCRRKLDQESALQHLPPKKRRKTVKKLDRCDTISAVIDMVASQGLKDELKQSPAPPPIKSESPELRWKKHDSLQSRTDSDSESERRLSVSQDSDWLGMEDGGGGGAVRKSRRRNKGKKYEQLKAEGHIHSSRQQHKQSRTDSQSEESQDKGDKDFTPSPGTIPPPLQAPGVSRKRKRTMSETSASEDGVKYKTGDFDLEEKIALLRPCLINTPPASSSSATSHSTATAATAAAAKKHKRLGGGGHKPRHCSTSALSGGGGGYVLPMHRSAAAAAALRRNSCGAEGGRTSLLQPYPVKSHDLNIAELRLVRKACCDAPPPAAAAAGKSSEQTTSNDAAGTAAAGRQTTSSVVTGSARRKVRKHAITRLMPLPGSASDRSTTNNTAPSNSQIVPGNSQNPPSNSQNLPNNSQSLPSNCQNFPSNRQNLPSNSQSLPSNRQNLPSNSQISPSNEQLSPSSEKENKTLDVNSNSSHHASLATASSTLATSTLPLATSPVSLATEHSNNLSTFAHLAVESREKSMRELSQAADNNNAISVSS